MNTRVRSEFKKLLFFFALGVLYYIFTQVTEWYIPCVFYRITGWQCPGCGISHMFVSLFRLEFKKAFEYNGLILVMLPFAGAMFSFSEYKYIKYGTRNFKGKRTLLYIAAAAIVLFGIMRNI